MGAESTGVLELLQGGMPAVARVRELEAAMREVPREHHVRMEPQMVAHGGVCARALLIPAGTLLTGALTNLDNVCIVLGDITVTTDGGPSRLTGFHLLAANRGSKRVGLAHADTWWITVHHTELTDFDAIAEEMTPEAALLQVNTLEIGA